jgi:hypothetical protein
LDKRWYLTFSVITALLLGAGFLLDYRSFAGNVLSELAGIALSAMLAILIFERLANRERQRRWEGVRSQLTGALSSHLADIAFEVYAALPTEVRQAQPNLMSAFFDREEMPSAVATVKNTVRANSEALVSGGSNAGPVYDAVLPNLNRIRDALVPQFLQLGHDPDLVVNLSRLESVVRVWEGSLRLNQLYGTPSTWTGVLEVLDAVHEVLEYLRQCSGSDDTAARQAPAPTGDNHAA